MIRTAFIAIFILTAMSASADNTDEWISFTGGGASYAYEPANVEVIGHDDNSLLVEMTLEGINVRDQKDDNRTFQLLNIPAKMTNIGWTKETGKPRLPIIRKLLAIPSESDLEIQIEHTERIVLKNYDVYPVGKQVVKYKDHAEYIGEEFAIDRSFYSSARNFYPQKLAGISYSGHLRDRRLVQLEFYPVRYNPSSGELMCHSLLQVRLSYGSYTSPPGGIYDYDISNYSIAGAPPAFALGTAGEGTVNYPENLAKRQKADYVIIVPEQFYGSQRIRKLADWRAQYNGFDVAVASAGKLYESFGGGRSVDEQIRSFVEYIYHYWKSDKMPDGRVGYLLLIGDVELLPIHISENNSFGEEIATDNWYVCVNGDDLMPDIMLGRLPVKTLTELNLMIDKIVQYEQQPLHGDWANNALLTLGTVDALEDDMEYARDEYLIPAGYNVSEVSGLDGGNASNVTSMLNAGQLIVDYAGHGWVNGWEIFNTANIPSLRNDRKLPVIFSLSCSTGKFDDPDSDSFGEVLLKERDGAIAFFGSSRLAAISDVGFGLSEAIARSHVGNLGEIAIHTKLKLLPNSTDMELYNLLGDPALDVFAARRYPNRPDLAISALDLSFEPQEPKQGEEVKIGLTVHNLGNTNARDVTVELRNSSEADRPDAANSQLIGTYSIPDLPAGKRAEIQAIWRTPKGKARYNIHAEVFPADNGIEHYVENNDASQELMVSLASEGWPIETDEKILSAPIAADIDGDGDMELLVQSSMYDYGRMYVWHHEGQNAAGWPQTITSGQYNHGSMYSNPSVGPAPAVGDIDGDGSPEIVAAFFRNEIWVWRNDGVRMAGWPVRTSGYATSSPALADLDMDGKLEIICGLSNGRMDVRRSDGSSLPGWPVSTGRTGHLFPVLSDIDGDSDYEIVALLSPLPKSSAVTTTYLYAWHHDGKRVEGWPVQLHGGRSILPPMAGDLDGDGKAEIVAPSAGADICMVYTFRHDGTPMPGWPVVTSENIRSAMSLSDLDQDGDIEVIACSYGDYAYAWHHDGRKVFGWPVNIGIYGRSNSAPVLGDVDGDDHLEVIFTSYGGIVNVINHNGSLSAGWPARTEKRYTTSPPVITDFDGDGRTELAYASGIGRVHMLSLVGNYNAQTGADWNMFLHDQLHTGSYDSKAILPRPPTDLAASDVPEDDGDSINLTWELSPDDDSISSYIIYRADSHNGKYNMVGKTSAGTATYVDSTVQVGTVYWYVVRASDGMYLSVGSNLASAQSSNNFAPKKPTTVSAYSGDMDSTLNVWWAPGEEDDLAGYRIYYGTASREYDRSINAGLKNYLVLTDLINGTKYYISVTSYDRDGNESLHSEEISSVPRDEDINPPSFSDFYPGEVAEGVSFFIKCDISDPSGVYDDSSDVDGQGVYLVWDNDGEILKDSRRLQMSPLNSSTYITDMRIPGQSVGTHFVYRVYAHDNDNDWDVAEDRTPGSSQEQMVKFLTSHGKIYNYPNPAPAGEYVDTTVFRYYVDSDSDVRISIYDIAGNFVGDLESEAAGGRYNEQEWNISNIASGVYVYVVEIQPDSGEKKVVKKKLAIIK